LIKCHIDFLSKYIAKPEYIINDDTLIVKSKIEPEIKIDKKDAAAKFIQNPE